MTMMTNLLPPTTISVRWYTLLVSSIIGRQSTAQMMLLVMVMMIEGEHVALQSTQIPLYINLEAGNDWYAP